jgi:hypothetical protein
LETDEALHAMEDIEYCTPCKRARVDNKSTLVPLPSRGDDVDEPRSASRGAVRSLAASLCARGTTVGGDSDDEADTGEPAKNASEHIRKLNLIAILSGKKKGQNRRNAEEFIKNNPDAADIDLLKEQIDLARRCTAFHRKGIETLDKATVDETCKLLKEHRVMIPTVAKDYILERSIADWLKDPRKGSKINEIVDMAIPWVQKSNVQGNCESEEDDTLYDFDPTKPSVTGIDASDLEKAMRVGDIVIKRVLPPMLKQEGEGVTLVLSYCDQVLSRLLEMPESAPEAFGEIVGELLMCFRAMLVMTFQDELHGGTHEDYEDLATPQKQYKLAASLNASLRATPFWKCTRADYLTYKVVNARCLPLLRELTAEINGAPSPIATSVLTMFWIVAGS